MKKFKAKLTAMLLTAVMALSMLPMFTYAAGVDQVIDTTKDGSLTIIKSVEDDSALGYSGIEGAEYVLYKVAKIEQTVVDGVAQTAFTTLDNSLPSITGIDSVNSAYYNSTVIASLDALAGANSAVINPTDSNPANADDVAKYYPTYAGGGTATDSTGEAYFGVTGETAYTLESGYVYLAVETANPNGVVISNNFLVTIPVSDTREVDDGSGTGTTITEYYWNYDVVAYPKNEQEAYIEKEAYLNGEQVDTANYGDTVSYKIKAGIPADIMAYTDANGDIQYYYSYDITDTASAGLSVDQSTISIKLYDKDGAEKTDFTSGSYTLAWDGTSNSYTISLINKTISDSIVASGTFAQNTYYTNYAEGDYLVITYDATIINSDDSSNTGGLDNTVEVDAGGDRGTISSGGKTIYAYDYRAWKVAVETDDTTGNDYKALAGAEFVLQNSAGDYLALQSYVNATTGATHYDWVEYSTYADLQAATATSPYTDIVTSFTSDDAGLIEGIIGLAKGTYSITEIKAPDGYALLTDGISITVDEASTSKANKEFAAGATTADKVTVLNDTDDTDGTLGTDYYSVQVINKSTTDNGDGNGWTLPSTGDMGIGIFILIGAVLILAALGLYVYNKRRNNSANKA